jgi:hypothetical protein
MSADTQLESILNSVSGQHLPHLWGAIVGTALSADACCVGVCSLVCVCQAVRCGWHRVLARTRGWHRVWARQPCGR